MTILQIIIYSIYFVAVITTSIIIIYDRREPSKALAWVVVVAIVPIVGIILYILFGRNHRKEKIFNRKEITDFKHLETMTRRQLNWIWKEEGLDNSSLTDHRDIITLLLNNNKAILTTHNHIDILGSGPEKFSSLFEALRSATSSIHIQYYIFEQDTLGVEIADLLKAKVLEGVEVRFLYDAVGSWSLTRKFLRDLRQAGIQVSAFMPVRFPYLTSRVNYRNHRKIVVVDGLVAFTGGFSVADRYLVDRGPKRWRDTHLRLEGDSVLMLQGVFATDWYFSSDKELLFETKYFPQHSIQRYLPVQIASSGPDSDWATIMQAYFSAMSRAKHHIYISTPYFMPNQAILTAIRVAALSGVDVRLLIPSEADHKIVYWATCSYIADLLEAGVKIYQYRRGFNHSKIIMIDGNFCSVGSANMDIRSFEVNFEVSAFIYDRHYTATLESQFLTDLRGSRQINARRWARRPKRQKFIEFLSSLFSPLF